MDLNIWIKHTANNVSDAIFIFLYFLDITENLVLSKNLELVEFLIK